MSESIASLAQATYAQRVAFVCEIAARLHRYGTTAQRLEAAIVALSHRLILDCEPWSNPTGLILSFSDPTKAIGSSDITRVIRLGPGDHDLAKLAEADRIAESVAHGQMSIAQGHTALRQLDRPPRRRDGVFMAASFGLTSAAVAGLWRLPWLDIGTAGVIGILIGLLTIYCDRRVATREASEALSALLAGFVAVGVAAFVGPLNLNSVIIASLVVLLPGLVLTNAVNELSSQHWVSGTARFAGALTTVLKLTVGAVIAVNVASALGIEPDIRGFRPQPDWVEWSSLLVAAVAFAMVFRAHLRDWPWVILAVLMGYVVSAEAGRAWGATAGVFLAALCVTAAGNLFGRLFKRPGAIVRLPGIIILVPGSTSLRGVMDLVQRQDLQAGQSAFLSVLTVVMALIAGLLFGNLLLPARKNQNL